MKMTRTQVYELIDGERDYQDNLPSSRTDGVDRTVGDYITMLQYYNQKLIEAWTMNPGNEQALDVMRKVAGIAVHCMEDWGSTPRTVASVKKAKPKKKTVRGKVRQTPPATQWPFPLKTSR